ncbi:MULTISPECIES: phosphoribosylanthranilate isomerase [Candidatus Methylopumilus]|uniref:phosphoribosylanthranilate isomerase n=1 Tax=Candidatus Methylopumilus TaxID=1679002 RepID=UPI00111E8ACD|nr:phosphoribosylanthranilate isomerase [Candidatus Methylopumilus planktonicus]QDD00274.1 phosphoribosylanthranilate isomerase [Candidatus Methylopumilus planktonicus]
MRTRTKICGITRLEDAKASVRAGCDALGFVFYKESPRYIALDAFKVIVKELPPFVTKTGLFVNADPAEIEEAIQSGLVNVLQFHGDETPDFCRQFNFPYIKAVAVSSSVDLIQYAKDFHDAEALLLDAYHEHLKGGTGQTFDWNLIPQSLSKPIVLAGGLTVDNVKEAIKKVKPYAVDVSGGVEESKGIKNSLKIQAFIKETQDAAL